MKLNLPEIIETYFQAKNAYDSKLIFKCFAEDAVLYDIGEPYYGSTAILNHLVKENNDLHVKTTINSFEENEGQLVVIATIAGNFNGSPVDLKYSFTLANNKIHILNITFATEK